MSEIVTNYVVVGDAAVRVDLIEAFGMRNSRVWVRTTSGADLEGSCQDTYDAFVARLRAAVADETRPRP